MATIWIKKNDGTVDEAKVVRPWEEKLGGGDKVFPAPDGDRKHEEKE